MAPSTLAVMKAVNRGEHRPRPVITPGRLAKKGVRRHPKPPVNGMRGEPGDGVTLQDEAERPASLQGLGPDRLRREEAGPAYETGGDDGATALRTSRRVMEGGSEERSMSASCAATIGAAIAVRTRYRGLTKLPLTALPCAPIEVAANPSERGLERLGDLPTIVSRAF